MFTPVFADASGWGLYLFFALINLIAVPIAWFFYPETAGRHLEEVDLIFAKAHVEKRWPFAVANDMPKLDYKEMKEMAQNLGIREVGEDYLEEGDSEGEKEKELEAEKVSQ